MKIPNSVTNIVSGAFANCNSLVKVIIGEGIQLIEEFAFYGCSKLEDLYCYAKVVPTTIGREVFKNSHIEKATLHVPATSVYAYKTTEPWSGFKEVVALTDSDPKPTGIKATDYTNNNIEAIFDINGRRVLQPTKGLYIKNGKKYAVK